MSNKCNYSRPDHSLLYLMVLFIWMNSCTDRTPQSATAIRNIVSQECASPNEVSQRLRRADTTSRVIDEIRSEREE